MISSQRWIRPVSVGFLALLALGGMRAVFRGRKRISLDGKTVLITGGSRGLGFILARQLALQGARVAICARNGKELRRAKERIEAEGGEVMCWECDVSDRSAVDEWVGNVVARYGTIDVVINNASIIQVGPVEVMSPLDFMEAMDVNFWGTFNVTLAALPWMKGQDGARIVNITSIGAVAAVPHLLPYTCAKFAAFGFSLGLRAELAELGIPVVTIVPGLMRTGSYKHALVKGRQNLEYAWFKHGSALPLISQDAERAAARIIRACRNGEAMVTLGVPYKLFRVIAAVVPGIVADLLGLVNRVLPQPRAEHPIEQRSQPGWRHESSASQTALVALGEKAARKFNEVA